MKKHLTILLFLISGICYGQTSDKFETYKISDYPSDKYQLKIDSVAFSKFKIGITQVKKIDSKWDSSSFYCRGWLTISQGGKVVLQKYFKSIEPVGGCSGLFIPDMQPRKDFFIFSKFGDYDGSIFILDEKGNLTEKLGGVFYISKDKQFLFSNYDSDAAGLTVFDFNSGRLLYSESDNVPSYLGDWYYQEGKYFAMAYDDDLNEHKEKIKIATFDFKTNNLVISTVDKTFLKEENKLEIYNAFQNGGECNCGR